MGAEVLDIESLIGQSSCIVAAGRALESKRPDRLFEDPYAVHLAGSYHIKDIEGKPNLAAYVSVRTHFIDQELCGLLEHSGDKPAPRQVVLLGAGMDVRAWRLPPRGPGRHPLADAIFEVDQKEVFDAKAKVMGQLEALEGPLKLTLAHRRVTVVGDLRNPDWMSSLKAAGFDPQKGTVWILEGLVRFFSPEEMKKMIRLMAENSPYGSAMLVTVTTETQMKKRQAENPEEASTQWRFGSDNPREFFSDFGWKVTHCVTIAELQAQYHRETEPSVEKENDSIGASHIIRAEMDLTASIAGSIGRSACGVAAGRALESSRSDRLFYDPLAKHLAGPHALAEFKEKAHFAPIVAVRTKYLDEELLEVLTESNASYSEPSQVVLLGAGMDSRAWRLPESAATPIAEAVFEVDQEQVLSAKEALLGVLAKAGKLPPLSLAKRRVAVKGDLRDPSWMQALCEAGYDRTKGTVWILEGLLRFFLPEQVEELIGLLSENCGVGSAMLITVPSEDHWRERATTNPETASTQWRFGTNDPETFFGLSWLEVDEIGATRQPAETLQ